MAVAVAALLGASACGTRLPDSRFTHGEAATTGPGGGTDVGVTGSQITIGLMASLTGPLGGEPVTTAYDQYPHLYSIAGTYEPRNGTVGWDGKIINSTEVYRYLHLKLGARVAAVVHYNQADSARYARQIEHGLRVEGFTV